MIKLHIEGLDKLEQKFANLPKVLDQLTQKTMETSLEALQQNVPEYPPPPQKTKYTRTGMLGKSLGAAGGQPTVYSITGSGINKVGAFGTNLSYAKYVIDEKRQAYMHVGRWWTMKTIFDTTKEKIVNLWALMIKKAIGD